MYFLDSSHIWHVAKSGSDTNSGHAGQYPVNLTNDAKLTISAAVTSASSGDTIIIWPGDYAENVSFGSKALTMIGSSRNKSRIIPATGTGIVLADNSVLNNLSVEAIQDAEAGKGVSCFNKTNIAIENCDFYGGYDGLYGYGVKSLFLRRCRIRGKYDGANLGGSECVVAEGCIFLAYGTYSTSVDCRALFGTGIGTYSNCVFIAERSDTTDSAMGAVCCSSNSLAVFKNCILEATAGSGHTGQAYGILVNGSGAVALLENCAIRTSSENAGYGPYDLRQATGKLIVSGCAYETTAGKIMQGNSKLNKAIKLLINKAIQNKSTGAIDYYDDDGSTILFTHAPTDGESSITRTPS